MIQIHSPRKKRKDFPFEGFIDFQGIPIDVENIRYSVRSGIGEDGTPWFSRVEAHYGEIRWIEGVDGDNLDVFVGENPDSDLVVVIHAKTPRGGYDEDKVMLGFDSVSEAMKTFKSSYNIPGFYQNHTVMTVEQLKTWCKDESNNGKKVVMKGEFEAGDVIKGGSLGSIKGIISTERRDNENQVVVQKGLDFTPFLQSGFLTMEHPRGIVNLIGEPISVTPCVHKGVPAHKIQGALWLKDPLGRVIYEKARAMELSGSDRRFGFSIEGKRTDDMKGDVLKAVVVKNCAITVGPKNTDAVMELDEVFKGDFDFSKYVPGQTGALVVESLRGRLNSVMSDQWSKVRDRVKRAFDHLNLSEEQIEVIARAVQKMVTR